MKHQKTLLGTLAAMICFAEPGAAQELVRVYSPQSYADVGTATNYRYGFVPFYPMSIYAPATGMVPYSTDCAPSPAYPNYYAPTYDGGEFDSPAPLVPGQPLRNRFRAMTW